LHMAVCASANPVYGYKSAQETITTVFCSAARHARLRLKARVALFCAGCLSSAVAASKSLLAALDAGLLKM
ncbi:MAG: hypothetical protein JXB47_18445, partial [Anaerolineae bacterium]|nr:hypothetical protein [Anaerolineae bacterium]